MKSLLLTVLFGIFCLIVISQTEPEKPKAFENTNSVQAELFGHGLYYSVSFEKIVLNGQRFKTSAQLGAAAYPSGIDVRGNFWVPVLLNEIVSFGNHHAEIGGGFLFVNEPVPDPQHALVIPATQRFAILRSEMEGFTIPELVIRFSSILYLSSSEHFPLRN